MITRDQREMFRRRLAALRRRLAGELSRLKVEALRPVGAESSGGLSNVPVHPADLAADTSNEVVTLGILDNEELIMIDVEAALERIAAGTFGRCVDCGERIVERRLQTTPYVPCCLACERKREAKKLSL